MRRALKIFCMSILGITLLAGCGNQAGQDGEPVKKSNKATESIFGFDEEQETETTEEEIDYLEGKHHIEIEVKDYGTIAAELDADSAPATVTNFISLAKEGFYDNLTFHRIISGFMIQGGDPNGNGTGGSGKNIKGEFTQNGVENTLAHTRGAVSMARSSDYDSASSQFFIVHEDSTHLDGQYAVFGYVTEGMEIVDKICEETPVLNNNGTVEEGQQPVITTIRVVD